MNEMGDLFYSHSAPYRREARQWTGMYPTGELLNLERQLARLYRFLEINGR